jgi:hypothetical protein
MKTRRPYYGAHIYMMPFSAKLNTPTGRETSTLDMDYDNLYLSSQLYRPFQAAAVKSNTNVEGMKVAGISVVLRY